MSGLFDDLVPAGDGGPPEALRITVTPNDRQPRGLRNNNPGNIEDGSFARSIPGYAGSDGRFAKYETPEGGQAAMDRLLESYGKRGFNTPASIIGRWAPAGDGNPVSAYSRYVAEGVGGDLTAQLDMSDPNVRRAIAERITQFENGQRAPAQPKQQVAQAQPTGLFSDLVPVTPPAQESPPAGTAPALMADPSGGRFSDTAGENFRTAREGESPAAPAKTSALEAGARGAATGVTANFYDELRGLMEAGGLDPKDPASLTSLLTGAYKYWTGDPEAAKRYETGAGRERELTKRAEADQPLASIAGNIAGGIALPLGTAARGATLADRATQGARVGAAVGGLSGVGAGEDTAGRVTGGAAGTAAGAVFGTVAPAAIEGVVKAGQGISRAVSPLATAMRGVRDPEAEAARRVTLALQRDGQSGSAGMAPAEFAAARAEGKPVVLGDMGGEATRGLARSAANTSSEGRAALETITSDRYATQAPRVSQLIKERFDFPDVGAKLDQIHEAARIANRPAYLKAYKEGSGGIWDDGLEQLSQAPVMQDAIRSAFITARNRGAMDGFPPVQNPFSLDKATGRYELREGTLPNLQFWDHVKRNLDRVNSPDSRAAAQILRDHLDQVVPSYQTARQGAAKFFGAEDALDAGAKFATMGTRDAVKLSEARRELSKMSAPERKLFETGFVSNLLAKIDDLREGQDIVKAIFNTTSNRQQIELALGKDKAFMLEATLQTERIMNALKGALGNSTTARQLYELGKAGATNPYTLAGAAGTASSYATGNVGPGDAFAAGLVFAARKGQIKIDERIARRVGEMLASDNPGVLKKGLAMVARSDTLKSALRAFDVPSSRIAGQQSPGLPALQSMGVGRTEDQPEIPRPPSQ